MDAVGRDMGVLAQCDGKGKCDCIKLGRCRFLEFSNGRSWATLNTEIWQPDGGLGAEGGPAEKYDGHHCDMILRRQRSE